MRSVWAVFRSEDGRFCLLLKDVIFVNEPTDMADWGMRTVHLYDPEDNLIELFSPLAPEQCSEELIEENKKYS